MITYEHTDPTSGKLNIVNLDSAAYVELERDSAHIRVVFTNNTELTLFFASADTAKSGYIQLRRKMEGV
jgi:hypothetical protein